MKNTEMQVGKTNRIESRTVKKPLEEVAERLRLLLAASNCSVFDYRNDTIRFNHGTYFTNSVSLLPKSGNIRLANSPGGTLVSYEIQVSGFAKAWMIVVAILTCWAIFPPIFVYRALVVHPKRFMDNLLAGI